LKLGTDLLAYAVCLNLFAAYKLFEIYEPGIPFLHSHLEDLLALPIILKSAQLSIQVLLPRQKNYRIPLRDSLLILAAFSIYYEAYLPMNDPRFTADPWDVLCYGLGFLAFEMWMNASPRGNRKNLTSNLWQK